jgi:sugar lactone lactonase YvrE
VYYDFQEDHGPGHDDHSDGIVRRYPEASLTRVAEVPGHMEKDTDTGWLYVADTGGGRVIRMDTATGRVDRQLTSFTENLREFVSMSDVTVETLVDDGLEQPCGLALKDRRVFVSDNATGVIHAFTYDGEELATLDTGARSIMGLVFGPEGKLWYVDAGANEVVRIDP